MIIIIITIIIIIIIRRRRRRRRRRMEAWKAAWIHEARYWNKTKILRKKITTEVAQPGHQRPGSIALCDVESV
jgi:hypothetical protein